MRADEEFVPERDEDEAQDAEHVVGQLAQDQTEEEEVEQEVEEEVAVSVLAELELVRRVAVVEVVRDLLAQTVVDDARLDVLTDHEREALAFLEAAIEGRTPEGQFIYAEQRLRHLNLVLADLQPLLQVGGIAGVAESLAQVVDGVERLRRELVSLEEAEEELFLESEEQAAEGDQDDDDQGDEAGAGEPGPGEATEATEPKEPTESKDQPSIKQEKLWRRVFKRKAPAADAGAPASGAGATAGGKAAAGAGGDAGDPGDERPRRSTVWDPDDQGGG